MKDFHSKEVKDMKEAMGEHYNDDALDDGSALDGCNENQAITEFENPVTVEALNKIMSDVREDARKREEEINEWLLALDGGKELSLNSNQSKFKSLLIRQHAEWRYAQLSDPFLANGKNIFRAIPRTSEAVRAARANKMILNSQFSSSIDLVWVVDTISRYMTDFGTCIVKIGWKEEKEIRERIITRMQVMVDEVTGQVYEEPYEEVEEYEHIIANHPTIEFCDPRYTIIDPACRGDYDTARFIIDPVTMNKSEMEQSGLYTNIDKLTSTSKNKRSAPKGLSDGSDLKTIDGYNFNYDDENLADVKTQWYWGEWDITGKGDIQQILAVWSPEDKVLLRVELNPYPDNSLPFCIADYAPRIGKVGGAPDADILEQIQNVHGALIRGVVDLFAKSANGQRAIDIDSVLPDELNNLLNGDDFKYSSASGQNNSPVVMHKYPDVPQSVYQFIKFLESQAGSLTGNNGVLQTGALSDMSATQSGIIESASALRTKSVMRRMAKLFEKIGNKIVNLNKEFLSDVEVIRMTDTEFVEIRRDELQGDVDIKLQISTPESENKAIEKLTFLLQTMGDKFPEEVTMKLLAEVVNNIERPDLARFIEEYQPQPNPTQQEIEMLNVELLREKVNNERALAKENEADTRLKRARANKLQADADRTELDWMMEADGTKLNREMLLEEFKSLIQRDSDTAKMMLDSIRDTNLVNQKSKPEENQQGDINE